MLSCGQEEQGPRNFFSTLYFGDVISARLRVSQTNVNSTMSEIEDESSHRDFDATDHQVWS